MRAAGDTFAHYTIECLLGQGGMGEVYRAFDTKLHRRVALKLLLAPEVASEAVRKDATARMIREARAAAALDHPNKVSVFELGEVDAVPYSAMEYSAGDTLRARVGDETVPWTQKLSWLVDVARALDAAHAAGLVHRDVKPQNVMVREDGFVKVLDFGIARHADVPVDVSAPTAAPGLPAITGAGVVIGTAAYMAPEQMQGRELDGRADQFAWGVMAFELLAGRHPWDTQGELLHLIGNMLTQPPAALRTLRSDVPESIAATIARTLSAKREDRFPRMADLVAELASPAPKPKSVAPASDARPVVAVLPFANLSDDKEQEYFSDGLTEDLITDLSRFSQLRVIARNSTFRYKGQSVDIAQIAKELGVRYVLEGSVRRAGEQVRITAKLVDAHTQSQAWAQRYDRPLARLFDVQDELTRAIGSALFGNLIEADSRAASAKAPHNLTAYEHTLLGRRYLRLSTQGDNLVKARDAFRKAIEVEPGNADAHRGLAQTYVSQGVYPSAQWLREEQMDRRRSIERAREHARKAVELDPRSELAHAALGQILTIDGRHDEGIASMERGIALNPNNPQVHVELCIAYRSVGRHEEAARQYELSLELDPFPSPRAQGMGAWALFMVKRYDEAIQSAQLAIAASPRWPISYFVLAATHSEMGEEQKARSVMAEVMKFSPSLTLREVAIGFQVAEDRERWIRAMRIAGVPE